MASSSVALVKKNQARKREKAVEAAKNHADFIKDILRRHNLSKTQTLKFEEVLSWLQMVGNAHVGSLPRNRANNLIDQNGKPRRRYARVAFELVLWSLGLIISCTGGRLRARTTSPQMFPVCPMDSEYPKTGRSSPSPAGNHSPAGP